MRPQTASCFLMSAQIAANGISSVILHIQFGAPTVPGLLSLVSLPRWS